MFLSLQLAVTGFYYTSASLLRANLRTSSLYFHPTEIFDTPDNSRNCILWSFFRGVFFFSYFLNAVSQPRQIEVSRWRFSREYKEEVSPGTFARFTRSLDVFEILYAKLSMSIGSFLRNWNSKSCISPRHKRGGVLSKKEKKQGMSCQKKKKKSQRNDTSYECERETFFLVRTSMTRGQISHVHTCHTCIFFVEPSLRRVLSVCWEIKMNFSPIKRSEPP